MGHGTPFWGSMAYWAIEPRTPLVSHYEPMMTKKVDEKKVRSAEVAVAMVTEVLVKKALMLWAD